MKILYSSATIHQKIATLGKQISNDYRGENVLVLGVLKGCLVFMSHLLVHLDGEFEIDTMTVSSYGGIQRGEIVMKNPPSRDLSGRHILLVEDIIDSGKTVQFVRDYLLRAGAKTVEIATFVNKIGTHSIQPKYAAFEYQDSAFLVGFGFDLDERFRNLPEVYQLESSDLSS